MSKKHRALGALLLASLLSTGSAWAQTAIKIGYLSSLTGPISPLGQDMFDGFMLGVEQNGGKLGGAPVQIIKQDDQFKPDVALQVVNRLIEKDNVPIIVGIPASNVMMAVHKTITDKEVFLIGSNAGPSPLAGAQCSPYQFISSWQNDSWAEAAGKYANDKGYKRMVLVASNYQAGKDAINGFKKFYKGVVIEEIFPGTTQPDFSAEMSQIAALKPDATFAFVPTGNINFIRQYQLAGLIKTVPLLTVGMADALTLAAFEGLGARAAGGALLGPRHRQPGQPAVRRGVREEVFPHPLQLRRAGLRLRPAARRGHRTREGQRRRQEGLHGRTEARQCQVGPRHAQVQQQQLSHQRLVCLRGGQGCEGPREPEDRGHAIEGLPGLVPHPVRDEVKIDESTRNDDMTASSTPRTYQQLIDGAWVDADGDRTFDDMNPYTGQVFARMPASSGDDARRAIDAAHRAFPAWAAMGARARQALFLKAADILERRADEIVPIMALETGSAAPFSRFQVQWATGLLRQAAGYPYLPGGEIVQSDTPGVFAMAIRKPLGVIGGISPWNGSLALGFRTIVAPLACGNTVVLKPSEDAPVLRRPADGRDHDRGGLPARRAQRGHARGRARWAPSPTSCSRRREVRAYNFTGSSARPARCWPRAPASTSSASRWSSGGYNPMLVLADADLGYSVDTAIFAAFFHQGQICMNTRKDPRGAPAVRRIRGALRGAREDDQGRRSHSDPKNRIGPLINDRAVANVKAGRGAGRSPRARACSPAATCVGRCFEPTVLVDVPADAPIHCEEVFGPVVLIEPFDDRAARPSPRPTAPRSGCRRPS